MAKTAAIKEGGKSYGFDPVRKLITMTPGGGVSTWVPEDEVQLVSKSIDSPGLYRPSDDNAYGYDQVEVDVDLPSLSVTKNGKYKASSQKKIGWSQVVVDLPKDTSGKTTEGDDYLLLNDDIGDVNIGLDDGDYNIDVDGENVSVSVKVKIVFTEAKTEYVDGDTLDLSDFAVGAMIGDEPITDVTDESDFGMADGTTLHYGTEYILTASWHYNGRTYVTRVQLNVSDGSQPSGDLYFNYWNYDYGTYKTYTEISMTLEEPVRAAYVLCDSSYTAGFLSAYICIINYGNSKYTFIETIIKDGTPTQRSGSTFEIEGGRIRMEYGLSYIRPQPEQIDTNIIYAGYTPTYNQQEIFQMCINATRP